MADVSPGGGGPGRADGPAVTGYEELERAGTGGFSTVYRARQAGFDRTVALKVLSVELFDEKAQHRFERECRASGRLSNHPNVVTVLDSGFTADGRPYIATEFMSNGALSDRLEREGTLPLEDVLAIGVKMCSALEAVHHAGILHRDIKPQNILVSDYGEPALADFGISAITVGPHATTGTSSLTPLHTAPEILEGKPTTVATDIYSLGSTLYMLLAGRAPFQGEDDEGLLPLMRRVVTEEVPPIDRPDVPPAVVDVLRWAMAKDPAARYPSAAALGEALQQLQAHLGLAVTPLALPGGAVVTTPRPAVQPGAGATPAASAASAGAAAGVAGTSPVADPGAGTTGAPVGPATAPAAAGSTAAAPAAGGRRTRLVVGAVVAVLAVLAIGALVLARGGGEQPAASGGGGGRPTTTTGAGGRGSTGGTAGGGTAGALTWPDNLRFDAEALNVPEGTPTRGGTLRLAVDQDPAGWNPAQQRFNLGAATVAEAIYEPLAIIGDQGPEPYLASAITPNAAADEWTITIPEGVRFSDGTTLDADAVKANLDARTTSDIFKIVVAPVASVRTTSPTTVVVKLRKPWPAFPVVLASEVGDIASPATLTGDGSTGVGTGPFALVDWKQGSQLTLQRNASFRIPDRPFLDTIDVRIVSDPDDRVQLLRSGQVDAAYLLDPQVVDVQRQSAPVLDATKARLYTVVLNTSAAPFDDLRLRKAATQAVDRQNAVDAAFGGKGDATESPFPPGSPWTADSTSFLGYDPDAAKALVAEARQAGKTPAFTLLTGTSPAQEKLAATLVAQWQAVGFDVTVERPEKQFLEKVIGGDYQAATWIYDTPTDPDEWYWWFHSSSVSNGETWFNLPRLRSPAVDKAFDDLRAAPDLDQRRAAAAKLEQALVDQVPAVWLATLPAALSTSDKVLGLQRGLDGGTGRGGRPWAVDVGLR